MSLLKIYYNVFIFYEVLVVPWHGAVLEVPL